MGVRSTFNITRDLAKEIILSKVATMSDEELASILYDMKESTYRNYRIVDLLPIGENEKNVNTIEDFNDEFL